MSEAAAPKREDLPKREGWGVSTRGGLLIAAGFFGGLFLVVGLAAWLYATHTDHPHVSLPRPFPAPALRNYQREPDQHLPAPDIGPPQPSAAQAAAIDAAMQALARRGDAGWTPLQPGGAP